MTNGEEIINGIYKSLHNYNTKFSANDSNEPIVRELTFEYMGLVATTTIIQAGVESV